VNVSDKDNEDNFGSKWEAGKKNIQQHTKKLASFSLLQAKSTFCLSNIQSALEAVKPALKLMALIAILLVVFIAIPIFDPEESTPETGSINGTSGVEIEKTAAEIDQILRQQRVQRNQRRQDQLENAKNQESPHEGSINGTSGVEIGKTAAEIDQSIRRNQQRSHQLKTGKVQESPHEDSAFVTNFVKQMEEKLDKESLQLEQKHEDEAAPWDRHDELVASILKRRAMIRMKRQQKQLKDGEVLKPDKEDPNFVAALLKRIKERRDRSEIINHA